MTISRSAIFLVTALCAALAACSPDCAATCEDIKEGCSDVEISNCQETCDDLEYIAQEEGCEEELDEWLSCVDDSDVTCDTLKDECGDEGDHVEECVKDYCEGKEGSKRCAENPFA